MALLDDLADRGTAIRSSVDGRCRHVLRVAQRGGRDFEIVDVDPDADCAKVACFIADANRLGLTAISR